MDGFKSKMIKNINPLTIKYYKWSLKGWRRDYIYIFSFERTIFLKLKNKKRKRKRSIKGN